MAEDPGATTAGGPRPLDGLRVALVEDDPELRTLLAEELAEHGVSTAAFDSAEALYRHLAVHPCDIVLLDVMLPGEDGYAVAAHLRAGSGVGIVMITGRGAPTDMAHGLGRGADLYLVKPLDFDVLVAGLAAVRRRLALAATTAPAAASAVPAVAPAPVPATVGWQLQSAGWRLHAPDGTVLELSHIERAFLQPLFECRGAPVDRETLIAGLTDEPWDFDPHRLEALVHRLRTRVLGASGHALPLRALRGAGYLVLPDPA